MFFSRTTYLSICVLFALSALFPNATITGRINDISSDEPLIGVNVILLETTKKIDLDKLGKTVTVQTNTNYGASTDVEGEFIIKNVPFGDYTLKAMYIGYENKETPISINEKINYRYDIKLDISEIALEETKVTATYEREEKKRTRASWWWPSNPPKPCNQTQTTQKSVPIRSI